MTSPLCFSGEKVEPPVPFDSPVGTYDGDLEDFSGLLNNDYNKTIHLVNISHA